MHGGNGDKDMLRPLLKCLLGASHCAGNILLYVLFPPTLKSHHRPFLVMTLRLPKFRQIAQGPRLTGEGTGPCGS